MASLRRWLTWVCSDAQKKDDASAARVVRGPSFEGGASITLVPSAGETPGTRGIVTMTSYNAVTCRNMHGDGRVAEQSLRTSRSRAFGAHPRCSDSPPRSVRKAALRPMSYVACGRSLVRNSPRGWAPKTLPDLEVRVGRAKACGGIVGRHAVTSHEGTSARDAIGNRRVPAFASASVRGGAAVAVAGAGDRTTQRLSPQLNRIVVRDLGVHPRGEFRTSGAAVGQIDTWAAVAGFPV